MNYQQKIVELLSEHANEPIDIEKIRVGAGIGNWNTALKHCLELLIDRKIRGVKTTKSWVFWVEKEASK